jgi:hypothetical protein
MNDSRVHFQSPSKHGVARIAARERVYDALRVVSQLGFDHFFCDEHRECHARMSNGAVIDAGML